MSFQDFKIDEVEDFCELEGTDLFTLPKVCKDIVESTYVEIPAAASAFSNSCDQPLEFQYKGTPGVYLDLSSSQVYLQCRLEKEDGSKITDADEVGPINFLGQ